MVGLEFVVEFVRLCVAFGVAFVAEFKAVGVAFAEFAAEFSAVLCVVAVGCEFNAVCVAV